MDLSGGGDEDGDIFSENSGVLPPLQSRREVVEEEEEEQVKQSPQKKVNIHTCTERCFYLYCIIGPLLTTLEFREKRGNSRGCYKSYVKTLFSYVSL